MRNSTREKRMEEGISGLKTRLLRLAIEPARPRRVKPFPHPLLWDIKTPLILMLMPEHSSSSQTMIRHCQSSNTFSDLEHNDATSSSATAQRLNDDKELLFPHTFPAVKSSDTTDSGINASTSCQKPSYNAPQDTNAQQDKAFSSRKLWATLISAGGLISAGLESVFRAEAK